MTARERRGRAAALLVAVLILGTAVVWYFGGESRAVEELPPPTSGAELASAELSVVTGVRTDARSTQLLSAPSWDLPGVDVRPAVRLAGDGRLTGRVLERESGTPVADMRVDLLPVTPAARDFLGTMLRLARASRASDGAAGGMAQRAQPVAVARTDAVGVFVFEGVRSGSYFLDPRGTTHVPDAPLRVRVAPSGAGGPVDVFVRRGARIRGQVLDAEGRPAREARVGLFPAPGDLLRSFRTGDLRRVDAICDANGRFDLAGVAPGTDYEVHAWGADFALGHAVVPRLEPGSEVEVVVRGRAAGVLRGRIVTAKRGGGFAPVAGAQLGVLPRGLRDMQFSEEVLAATAGLSAEDGTFRVSGIPPGHVELLVVAPGHVALAVDPVRVGPGAVVDLEDLVVERGPVVSARVVDNEGAPLAGVSVRWFLGRAHDPRHLDISFAPFAMQAVGDFAYPESDADGRFLAGPFPGEPPYSLYLAKEGYPYTRAIWRPSRTFDPGAVDAGSSDGGSLEELEIVLAAGASVEGVVVHARDGSPVTSFHVSGTDRIDVDYREPSAMNPFSGDLLFEHPEGRFRVPAVRATGDADGASLTFSAPGFQPRTVRNLALTPGETLPGVVVELVPGGIVRGRVLDATGEPVPGAQVGALAGGSWSIDRTFGRVSEHFNRGLYNDTAEEGTANALMSFATRMGVMGEDAVVTDQDGAFELDGLGTGTYSVVARHRDHALARSESFELAEGESREGLELVMTDGASLWGEISDTDGRPLPGATLLAISPTEFSGDHSAEAAVYQGTADAAGLYEIEHMAGGSYFLTVMRADGELNPESLFGSLQLDMVSVPPGQRVRHDVEDASAGACRVFGRVVDAALPSGNAAGGSVLAVGLEADNLIGLDFKVARVDARGRYEFPGLASGRYEFTYQSPSAEVVLSVDIPDDPELELDFALPTGRVTGRVVASATGQGVPRARVSLARTDSRRPDRIFSKFLPHQPGMPQAQTDADGRFAIDTRVTGAWRAFVGPGDGAEEPWPYAARDGVQLEVPEAGGLEVVLELAPELIVEGRVTDEQGRPVDQVEVTALDDQDQRLLAATTYTGEDGAYLLRDLAAGDWTLRFRHAEHAEALVPIRLGDAPLAGIDARLERGSQLVLRVRDDRGRPASGAVARVAPASAASVEGGDTGVSLFHWFVGNSVSDAAGRLDAGRFTAGTYRVEVRLRGRLSVLEAVQLGSAGTAEFEVRFE